MPKKVHELEGDLEGLRLVDLDREGLSEYRTQLKELGFKQTGSKSSINSASTNKLISASVNKLNSTSLNKIYEQRDSTLPNATSSSAIVTTTTELLSSASAITTSIVSASPLVASSAMMSSASTAARESETKADALAIIDNVFNQIDTNNDGNIEIREAERIFLRLNSRLNRSYGEDEVKFFFQKLDTNMDSLIDLNEFRTAMLALI